MSADSERLQAPNDPGQFESLCLDLFKELWSDPNADKNGRSGQPQAGVDIFGRRAGRLVGVQCKQNDILVWRKITAGQLEAEAGKARLFHPALSEFILATTGPADANVQKRARELTAAFRHKGLFTVTVWSWRKIWTEIHRRQGLLESLGPAYWPRLWQAFSRNAGLAQLAATLSTRPGESAESVVARAAEISRAAADAPEAEAQTEAIIKEVFEATHDELAAGLRSFVGDSKRLVDSLMRQTFPINTVLRGLFGAKPETAGSRRGKFAALIDYAQKNLAQGGPEWFVQEINLKLDFPGRVVYAVPCPPMTLEETEGCEREEEEQRNRRRENLHREHPDWPDDRIEEYLNTFSGYSAEEPSSCGRSLLTDAERIKNQLLRATALDFWTCRWLVTAQQAQVSCIRRESGRPAANRKRQSRRGARAPDVPKKPRRRSR
jgi:hypothetical protein